MVATVVTAAAPWTMGEHELRIEEDMIIAQRKRIFFIKASYFSLIFRVEVQTVF